MSAKPILIVESPSKARTISRYLANQYEVLACVGHIKDLPKKELGVFIEHDFRISLRVLPDRRAFIKKLKAAARSAPEIILATDPDREGEAIAAHIADEIPGANLARVQFTEITREGIAAGMSQRRTIDERLVQAQQTRRIIDRLVGYKVSPVLWNTLQKNMKFVRQALSAGRVQSAAIKILVDRERLRSRFRETVYYNLTAGLTTPDRQAFSATLYKLEDRRLATSKDFDSNTGERLNARAILLTRPEAETLVTQLRPGPWVVTGVDEKPLTSRPSPPFMTSTLQQEASRRLRFSARKTMRVAQSLYEAGYITYMRTDSTQLSQEALSAARAAVEQLFGREYLPPKAIQYTRKVKNAQEAHEAIRPAGGRFAGVEQVSSELDRDAARLYELIWKRTLACQMKPAQLLQTTVSIGNQQAEFRATGKVVLFPGYRRVYERDRSQEETSEFEEHLLPPLQAGDSLECESLAVNEHATKPPARYTEAALVKELETRGIGRPSTYANIIERIQQKDYVDNRKGTLVPTFLAVTVVQLLENHFASLVDSKFTADMEDNLDAISRGELEPLPFMKAFYYGNPDQTGLEQMLQADIDIRRACTIPVGVLDDQSYEVRVGNYGPYIQSGKQRRQVPAAVAPGDMTPELAQQLLGAGEEAPLQLGTDPEKGEPVYRKTGPYGPYVQRGNTRVRKSIPKDLQDQELTLELALQLLQLPRYLGSDPETGEAIQADYGRFGPYIRRGKTTRRLSAPDTPLYITLARARELLAHSGSGTRELRSLGRHSDTGAGLSVKQGRYGPYITDGKVNVSIPKGRDPETITLEEASQMISKKHAAGPTRRKGKK